MREKRLDADAIDDLKRKVIDEYCYVVARLRKGY